MLTPRELFQGKKYTGPEVDVWSLGVILYVLTTGCLPFDGKNLQDMRESVCRGKYRIPFYLSESSEKLLRKFLVRDPVKRPTLEILHDDEWLNEGYETSPVVQDQAEQVVGEDQLILSIMESKFGVTRDVMLKALRENHYDETLAIYFLLWDEKQKSGEAAVIKISEQMAIKTPAPAPAHVATSPAHPVATNQAHTPIGAISEEDGGSGEVVTVVEPIARRRMSITPHGLPPAANGGPIQASTTTGAPVVPRGAAVPVRRTRRFTVSGENEMKKMADEEKNDPDLLAKLQALQVNGGEVKPADTTVRPRVVVGAASLDRPRPASIAVPNEVPKAAPAPVPAPAPAGFLKMRRASVSGNQGPVPTGDHAKNENVPAQPIAKEPSVESIEYESSGAAGGEAKPRSLRFTFNSNTTSSKAPDEIMQEVQNACIKHGFKTRLISRYLVELTAQSPSDLPGSEPAKVEVEVCKLPRLKNLHGLRFKRVSGASSDYKTLCEQILGTIKL